MAGIGTETAAFLHACLTGITVTAAWLWLRVWRRILPHGLWLLNLEDGLFWAASAVYIFVQIYHTNNGEIRWYFVLGVVVGSAFLRLFCVFAKKIQKKIYVLLWKKPDKNG
ncbi:hypothetical protein K280104A7_05160 [Candidatus Bariatricus faecipullorum]